jgi:hypothetical protein
MPSANKETLHTSGTRRDIKQVIERLLVIKSQYTLRLGFQAMRRHAVDKRHATVILARLVSRACFRAPVERAFEVLRHHNVQGGVENPVRRLVEALR